MQCDTKVSFFFCTGFIATRVLIYQNLKTLYNILDPNNVSTVKLLKFFFPLSLDVIDAANILREYREFNASA